SLAKISFSYRLVGDIASAFPICLLEHIPLNRSPHTQRWAINPTSNAPAEKDIAYEQTLHRDYAAESLKRA
ncbi:hypothetical protein ACV34H_34540, partial [Pseudomonas aeruginosa]